MLGLRPAGWPGRSGGTREQHRRRRASEWTTGNGLRLEQDGSGVGSGRIPALAVTVAESGHVAWKFLRHAAKAHGGGRQHTFEHDERLDLRVHRGVQRKSLPWQSVRSAVDGTGDDEDWCDNACPVRVCGGQGIQARSHQRESGNVGMRRKRWIGSKNARATSHGVTSEHSLAGEEPVQRRTLIPGRCWQGKREEGLVEG